MVRAARQHPAGHWSWGAAGSVAFRVDLEAGCLLLAYVWAGVETSERIALTPTPCNFGGFRWWARCPACDRRIAILYGVRGAFRCRRCLGLVYESTRESAGDRALRKSRKIRARLAGPPGIIGALPAKPPRMWWRTYGRLAEQAAATEAAWLAASAAWRARCGPLVARLG